MKTKHTVIPQLMRNPQLKIRFCVEAQNDNMKNNILELKTLSFRT